MRSHSGERCPLPALGDVPDQLAQLGDGAADLGIVTRRAAPSAIGLDRPEPFLEHGNRVLDGRPVEGGRRWTRRSAHRFAEYHAT